MQATGEAHGNEQSKDEIIKRQALEIACLAARIDDQDSYVTQMVQERTAELVAENQRIQEGQRQLQATVNNALKSLRILCRDEGERMKFLLALEVFDDEWYLSEYPDVANNYAKGALHHFCKFGIFEGRKPNRAMSA